MKDSPYDQITPSAEYMAYYRGLTDIPYAREISELIGAEKTARVIFKEAFDDSLYLAVVAEARYKRINAHIQPYKNILEVAVGRSPRGLEFTADPSVHYVATDLPQSLEAYRVVVEQIVERYALQRPNLHMQAAHALIFSELRDAAALLPEGPIAIISEGMLSYFTREEQKIFLDTVRWILEKRGGALFTTDVLVYPTVRPASAVFQHSTTLTGRDMRQAAFQSYADAQAFVRGAGYSEELSFEYIDTFSIHSLGLEENFRAKRASRHPLWVLTPLS